MNPLLNKYHYDRLYKIKQWKEFLKNHSACTDMYEEAHTKTAQEWYNTTERFDWMIWTLNHCSKNKAFWVQIAANFAKEVAHCSIAFEENKPPDDAHAYNFRAHAYNFRAYAAYAALAAMYADDATMYADDATMYADDAAMHADDVTNAAMHAADAANAAMHAAADAYIIYKPISLLTNKTLCDIIRKESPILIISNKGFLF